MHTPALSTVSSNRSFSCRGSVGLTWIGSLAFLLPMLAQAHPEHGGAGGLASGLHHPFSGLDHLLVMLAVGFWAAQLGRRAMWLLPVVFPGVMALGALLGMSGLAVSGVEIGIALSAVVIGVLVVTEFRPPLWLSLATVGFFAMFHGLAHGAELPVGTSGSAYILGFVLATALLHVTGIAVGVAHRWPVGRALVRVSGVAVAVCGALFLWQAVG